MHERGLLILRCSRVTATAIDRPYSAVEAALPNFAKCCVSLKTGLMGFSPNRQP
jgi:hypothetical protein